VVRKFSLHYANPALNVKKIFFLSATGSVGMSFVRSQEQGMRFQAKEVSAIKRATREACRTGHFTQPSFFILANAIDPASAASFPGVLCRLRLRHLMLFAPFAA
jgi:hypothetical protein